MSVSKARAEIYFEVDNCVIKYSEACLVCEG